MLQPRSGRNCTWYEIFFFISFSACPIPVWHEMKPGFKFFFLNYFTICFEFFWECSSFGQAELVLGMKFFFTSFSSCPGPIYLKMKLEWIFLNFPFFLGMLKPKSGRNGFRNKIFFPLFFGLSQPDLSRNEAKITFFKFFTIFFGMLWLGSREMVPRTKIFFLFFFLSQLGLAWNEARMTFSNFLNYFNIFKFFLGMLGAKRYSEWKKFSLFSPVLAQFIYKWSQNDLFNFFIIFLGILQPGYGRKGTWKKKGKSLSLFFFFFFFFFFNFFNFFTIFCEFSMLGHM